MSGACWVLHRIIWSWKEKIFPFVPCVSQSIKKFGQTDLSHQDYLGSILGLGIDRGKVGDILVSEEQTICFVSEEIADYILVNLEKVSRTPVQVEKTDLSEIEAKKEIEVRRLTVASMRLDAVAGSVLHLSRGKVQALIAGEKANVNWNVTTNPSLLLKEGDMVSVRCPESK